MSDYKALISLLQKDNRTENNEITEPSDESESSCEVGAILQRTSDFAPNLYTEDEEGEEDCYPVHIGQNKILSLFWDHLHSSPTSVDRTHFRVAKEIAELFTYKSDIVAAITCSCNLSDSEVQSLLAFQQKFIGEYSEALNPEEWSLLAKLRTYFDSKHNSANQFLYKRLLGLFSSRTSVVCTSPSYDVRVIYQEAAVAHLLNQAIQHAARRYDVAQDLRARRDMSDSGSYNLACNGYTRTHTLVLLPTRHASWRFVMTLLAVGLKVFELTPYRLEEWEEKFGCDEDEQRISCPVSEGGSTHTLSLLADEVPDALNYTIVEQRRRNTAQWYRSFCGNTDDNFNFGIQIHGNKIVLLTPLRVADIIVASPLGLRQQCNIDPTTDNTFKARVGDGFKIVNFIGMLSSLHTLFIGDIDALEMQNWEHFLSCIWGIHKPPREGNLVQTRNYACDIRTYLPAYLHGQQRCLLQVLAVGECFGEDFNKLLHQQNTVEAERDETIDEPAIKRSGPVQSIPMNEAFATCSLIQNSRGLVRITSIPTMYPHIKLRKDYPFLRIVLYRLEKGAVQARQTDSIDERRLKFSIKDHAKIDYCINILIPRLIKVPEIDKYMLFVVPNYYTMVCIVRVLKLLAYSNIAWGFVEESATLKEITQLRRKLESGALNFLIVTERILYYRQPPFSKLQNVIFLSPPRSPELLINTGKYFNTKLEIPRSLIVVYIRTADATRLGNCFPPDVCVESMTRKTTMFLNE